MGLREDVEREWLEREQRIVRYCAGRMSAVDEAAFDAELLEDAELATDVQLAMVLRDALQGLEPVVHPAVINPPKANRPPWLALAAGVLLGTVGLSVVRAIGGASDPIEDVEYLTLGVVRSAEPQIEPRIQRVSGDSLLVVEVPAELSTEQIEVIRPGGKQQVLTGTRDEGYLRIALPPPIKRGEYTIVSGDIRYSFTIEPRVP